MKSTTSVAPPLAPKPLKKPWKNIGIKKLLVYLAASRTFQERQERKEDRKDNFLARRATNLLFFAAP
jgi:hypothetical protein